MIGEREKESVKKKKNADAVGLASLILSDQ